MRHERDHSFVNVIDKISTKPFAVGSVEANFCSAVTPFAVQFILKQLQLVLMLIIAEWS